MSPKSFTLTQTSLLRNLTASWVTSSRCLMENSYSTCRKLHLLPDPQQWNPGIIFKPRECVVLYQCFQKKVQLHLHVWNVYWEEQRTICLWDSSPCDSQPEQYCHKTDVPGSLLDHLVHCHRSKREPEIDFTHWGSDCLREEIHLYILISKNHQIRTSMSYVRIFLLLLQITNFCSHIF